MKYGIISYEKKLLKLDGRDAQNIGDWLQMFAMQHLLKEWGVSDVIRVSRNEATLYGGESCLLLVNGFFTCNDAPHISTKTFPFPEAITPIFLSFHFHDRYIPLQLKEQLKAHEPIGCRDEETTYNLRRNGITAYTTGCVSALLPRREEAISKKANKIIFVDIPESLFPYIPEEYRGNAEYFRNVYPISRIDGEHAMTKEESEKSYAFAKERYDYYYRSAKLIVTSRLHVAAPAIAMGIPCILVSNNFDARYSWIDKFLPLYTPQEFSKINWNPSAVEYEQEKTKIKQILKRVVCEREEVEKGLQKISWFYENREREEYNSAYINGLKKCAGIRENTKYAIWGTVTSQSNQLKHCIDEMYPSWEFVGIYDKVAQGNFEGYTIQSSDLVEDNEEILYFVMSKAIYQDAKQKLLHSTFLLVDITKKEFKESIEK